METIADYVDFVKKQIEYQDRRATMNRGDPKKLQFHVDTAARFRSLLDFLERSYNEAAKPPAIVSGNPTGSLLPKELSGLPQELIDELSIKGTTDKQEILITELIDAAGGALSLDRILIGVYRNSGTVIKRPVLTSKLYRMQQKKMIFKVPHRKAIYSTDPHFVDIGDLFLDNNNETDE